MFRREFWLWGNGENLLKKITRNREKRKEEYTCMDKIKSYIFTTVYIYSVTFLFLLHK